MKDSILKILKYLTALIKMVSLSKQHVYQGEFKEGKPNGKGKLIFRDNE